ncbi:MAG: Txe/YoeB family addiction module toxin [Bacteroidales bacterium]|jgi:toxin YoeB|nr:Txe/YoeB family addiction module toxin [Bacteroidales bacterium]
MKYQLIFSKNADNEIDEYIKSGNKKLMTKLYSLFEELVAHPKTGTGKPEQLKYEQTGKWSRRISQEHRLVYRIDDINKVVNILQLKGHY